MFVGLAPLYLQYAACSFSYLYLVFVSWESAWSFLSVSLQPVSTKARVLVTPGTPLSLT